MSFTVSPDGLNRYADLVGGQNRHVVAMRAPFRLGSSTRTP